MKHTVAKSILFGLANAGTFLIASPASAQDADAELAKKLSNPIADLISIPLQNNWDFNIGPEHATRYMLNVQPVIPFALSSDLNLITRTIIPVIDLEEPVKGFGSHSGLGDISQSFFFSPKPSGGFTWGVGPVLLYPSATDPALGSGHWGMGPTLVMLTQSNGWTVGLLANQIWSFTGGSHSDFAGQDDNPEVNATYLQPFVAFTTKTKTTFTLNTESTYDWTQHQWTVPLSLQVSQLFKVGPVPFSAALGGRYYVDGPSGGPNWGLRFTLTMMLPAK